MTTRAAAQIRRTFLSNWRRYGRTAEYTLWSEDDAVIPVKVIPNTGYGTDKTEPSRESDESEFEFRALLSDFDGHVVNISKDRIDVDGAKYSVTNYVNIDSATVHIIVHLTSVTVRGDYKRRGT